LSLLEDNVIFKISSYITPRSYYLNNIAVKRASPTLYHTFEYFLSRYLQITICIIHALKNKVLLSFNYKFDYVVYGGTMDLVDVEVQLKLGIYPDSISNKFHQVILAPYNTR
jgi:hypothetical protein